MKKIILKSSSPRRKEIMEKAGYQFTIKVFDVDETFSPSSSPLDNVKALGLKKALINATDFPNEIQIGCDTIVILDNIVYGKPHTEEDAYRMLKAFSGKTHQVASGVGIIYNSHIFNFVVVSNVTFKELSDQEIKEYIDTKECFGKAGSYAIQGIGKKLVENYDGSLSNIIGLPIEEVSKIIGEINGMDD